MPNMTINAKHPVRRAIADLPDYYDSLALAFDAIDDVLADYGMQLDYDGLRNFDTVNGGSQLIPIVSVEPIVSVDGVEHECTGYNNGVNVSYYKLSPGRWEIIKYVS